MEAKPESKLKRAMKKILAIAPYPYLPYFSGGQKFIAQFFHHLGHETDLTVISTEGNDFSLATTYNTIPLLKKTFSRYYDLSLIKKITAIIKEGDFDTVIWEHPYYAWLAYQIRKRTGIKTLIHTHNIEYQRFKSTGRWWWPILKWYERNCFKKADGIFFITPEDKSFAINSWKIDTARCFDLPFGVEIEKYPEDRLQCRNEIAAKHGITAAEKIILFNGLLNYKPNLDALKIILEQVNPILLKKEKLLYKIIICGKGLPENFKELKDYTDKNIIYAGFVDDITLYFKGSDLMLNPVQSGGGVKTKMVEAIAFGTTVIATETGSTGIDKQACGSKLIVIKDNNWIEFADKIVELKSNEDTPASFYAIYNWDMVIKKILPCL